MNKGDDKKEVTLEDLNERLYHLKEAVIYLTMLVLIIITVLLFSFQLD